MNKEKKMLTPANADNINFAVLIDADNAPRGSISSVMEEIAVYGTPTIKRIYGDWTSPQLASWKLSLLQNAITPIQQYGYTTGKNSTDSAMIIDAMDILYAGNVNGFVLVSSDSDFTRLAIRLREAGMKVLGIGERKTPSPFIAACDKFIYIEVIRERAAQSGADETAADEKGAKATKTTRQPKAKSAKVPTEIVNLIASSISDISDDDGNAFMGELGNLILKKRPDFDCRNFGHKTLSSLIKSIDRFDIEFRQTSDPNIKHPYVKDKRA